MRKGVVPILLLILAAGAGCSDRSHESSGAVEPTSVAGLVSLLRQTASYSFLAYPDPAAMLRAVDIAALGTVVSVEPALVADDIDGQGAVIVGVEPTEVWKDALDRSPGLVYYWFHRPKNVDIGGYRQSLPAGSEIVLFGFDVAGRVSFATGAPEATIYEPAPQGFYLFAENGEVVNVWGDSVDDPDWTAIHSLADLRRAIGELASSGSR